MEILILSYIFLLGLYFGSFFNVVGIRVPKKETLLGRSHCTNCDRQLNHFELFPVIGYLVLKGRCKGCNTKISPFYPIMELLTAILFTGSYFILQDNLLEFSVVILFISLLIIITVSDVYYQIVPDIVLLVFGVLILVLRIIGPTEVLIEGLIGAVLGFGFLYLIAWYGKKRFKTDALGGGDIKLYLIIGLVLGYELVFLSLLFASLIGLLYNAFKRNKDKLIPFVPFIFAGALLTYYVGDTVIEWYLNLIF